MTSSLAAVLARPDVWRGDRLAVAAAPALPTGFAALDAELPGGGWPRGQLTELLHAQHAIGELALLLPALARLTAAGEAVMLVSPPAGRVLHAPGWDAAGVRLEHLHLLFPQRPRDALWTAVEALRCAAVKAALIWLEAPQRGGLATSSVRRLHLAAGEGGGCGFLFRPAACAAHGSPAPLRLRLGAGPGARLRVEILKRRGVPAQRMLELAVARPAITRPLSEPVHALAGAVAADRRGTVLSGA